ncbi:MAG: carboxylating nicotinate-nucleotide diphosphorylase [Gammaproteobacteria bacterium]|nr:carboxylating nicotinate-nucleotide diphosphorylase [Gammaproteobacteria bacterium]NIR97319.1 carboxylating nicotinate-nucleotide diphosphorylase [Gammaproteobacteria bacterium]NIT63362.1 carboxylating nicotinate-nucleotide diphosphorylase [Gammaproteobacteria bacterium]NIV20289.1 carboxylating nicotinate-nucleotide diphosphorylase [Gammaproteobacteria bacterium]NIX10706.1 carboxylating nicotinate-nucleotide diphosphorylase [Gammaproteobacteria bacterium]
MEQTPSIEAIRRNVSAALAEDVGTGDVTAALISGSRRARASVVSRERAVLCGTPWFDEVYAQLDPEIVTHWHAGDGEAIAAEQVLCVLEGPARAILTGERTALNFLQLLSGTATAARRYADAVRGSGAAVLDTRKTLPGLRHAQKYATRCGGCLNHRMGLYDGVLIKENHIAAAGSIAAAMAAARRRAPGLSIEVEVEDQAQLEQALEAGAETVLLDNFDLTGLRRAVKANAGRTRLEASGGVTLETIAAIAATGVDYVSVGTITKDVRAVDLSLRFDLD